MNVNFFNSRSIPKEKIIRKFAQKICARFTKNKDFQTISIIFVSDKEVRALNHTFLKQDRPTDVIAFNYTLVKNSPSFGDIYISVDTACRQAKWGKYPYYKEIALLVLHGLLHLFGYEDETKKQKEKMIKQQKFLFHQYHSDLAPPDFAL